MTVLDKDLMKIKGSFTVQKNNVLSNNIRYKLLFLNDQLLFVKIGGEFASQGGTGSFFADAIGYVLGIGILAPIGGQLYGRIGFMIFALVGCGLGAFIAYLFRKKNKKKIDQQTSSLNEKSVEEVIHTDKKNFAIPYNQISNIQIKNSNWSLHGFREGILFIEANKKFRFDIPLGQPLEQCKILISSTRLN